MEDDASSDGESELEEEEDNTSDGIVLFIAFIIYIIVGSIAIAAYEPNMNMFEAIYFNFVTLTTIGLGDLVPQSDTYLVITLIYCAVGLALTTIAIEIAADTLKKLHYFGRKVENVANVQVWFGGKKISMKALVKNLGDQFNVPLDELETLNLEQFVDNAIKVEEGELATLRVSDQDFLLRGAKISTKSEASGGVYLRKDLRGYEFASLSFTLSLTNSFSSHLNDLSRLFLIWKDAKTLASGGPGLDELKLLASDRVRHYALRGRRRSGDTPEQP
ncbi:hypothetical protein Y032_0230g2934 [Ancylostoma ceylanicum]|uniref:Potassium channel domain-containing protein n=2 Tax=Ancylostoma ceylanicum TaxID=53326 RepID=A0A016SGQ0_9BILA|nr:hypothetical protein Y032_0230g2934 [Ancylostoma ceylanicum]